MRDRAAKLGLNNAKIWHKSDSRQGVGITWNCAF